MLRWLVAAQSVALAVLVSWPMPAWFPHHTLGHAGADGVKHLWTLWWMRAELFSGEAGLLTRFVNFPEGAPLYPVEPLNGLLAAALPLPPLMVANALALVHLVGVGLAAGWLGWLVTGRKEGALACAALMQGGTWVAFTLQVGVGELRQAWWLPLGFAVLLRAQATKETRWFAALGAVGAAATVACLYYGFLLAMGVAVHGVVAGGLRERRVLLGYAGAAALAAVLVAPALIVFGEGWKAADQDLIVGGTVTRPFTDEALRIHELVWPRGLGRASLSAMELAYGGGRYLGIVTLGLAIAGAWRAGRAAWAWVAVGVVGIVLALGTVLLGPSGPVTVAGQPVILPLGLLYDALGKLAAPPNFPARFLALTAVVVAVLGAMAARGRWAAPLVLLALIDVAALGVEGWPRRTFSMPPMEGLAAGAGEGAVLEMGMMTGMDRERRVLAMAAQMEMGRPVQAVAIERLDAWFDGGMRWAFGTVFGRDLARVATGSGASPRSAEAYRADWWMLRERGFDRLLMTHRRTGLDARVQAFLDAVLGAPIAKAACGQVWAVPEVDARPQELESWRRTHAERAAKWPEQPADPWVGAR